MITPTKPFKDIVRPPGADVAQTTINSMSEEQVRYALWAALVLLFGAPESNAIDIVLGYSLPSAQDMAEAHVLLCQIGCGKCEADEVESKVKALASRTN